LVCQRTGIHLHHLADFFVSVICASGAAALTFYLENSGSAWLMVAVIKIPVEINLSGLVLIFYFQFSKVVPGLW
jgi:hypothetical protein